MLTVIKSVELGTELMRMYFLIDYPENSVEYKFLRKEVWAKIGIYSPRLKEQKFFLEAGDEAPSIENEDVNFILMVAIAASYCEQLEKGEVLGGQNIIITTRHEKNIFLISGIEHTIVCVIRDGKACVELWDVNNLSAIEESKTTFFAKAKKKEKYEGGKKK